MGVLIENSLTESEAAERFLNPQSEKDENIDPEQETQDDENNLVDEEIVDESEDTSEDENIEEEEFEDETEVGDSEEEDESDNEDEPDEKFYDVKVDGVESQVNEAELIKSYQLEANYTKKSQALAAEKAEVETLKAQLTEQVNNFTALNQKSQTEAATQLQTVTDELAAIDKTVDPQGYMLKAIEKQELEAAYVKNQQDANNAVAISNQMNQEDQQKYLNEQMTVLSEKMEGFSDETTRVKKLTDITNFGVDNGFSTEELQTVVDARQILILEKAMKYDDLVKTGKVAKQKRVPKKATPKVKSAKPKTNNEKKKATFKEKQKKFKSSGGSNRQAQTDMMLELLNRK